MNLVYKYIEVFKSYLPQDIKEDVGLELQLNIEDRLGEYPTQVEIEAVLLEMGDPKILAKEYNPSPNYLIGPLYYDSYILLLKTLVPILGLSVGVLDSIIQLLNGGSWLSVIISFLATSFNTALYTWGWLTLVFAIIQYSTKDKSLFNIVPKWSLESLEKQNVAKSYQVNRTEEIVSIVFSIIFLIIFYKYMNVLAVYITVNGEVFSVPAFNIPVLQSLLPFIIFTAVVGILVSILKIVIGKLTKPILWLNILDYFIGISLLFIFVGYPNLINPDFVQELAKVIPNSSVSTIEHWINTSLYIVYFIVFIISIYSIGKSVYLLFKLDNKSK